VRIASINGTSVHSYFLSTLTSFSMKQSSFGILISHPCGAYMLAAPWPGTAWNRMNFCFNAHTLTGENGWVSPERQLMFLHQSAVICRHLTAYDTWVIMQSANSKVQDRPCTRVVLLVHSISMSMMHTESWFIACHWRADSWQLTFIKAVNLLRLLA